MLCPRCRSERCRRSRRRRAKDYAIGLVGLRPWRCRGCDLRFYARSVALPFTFYVHCHRCGNLSLQRISREHVSGWFAWLFRLARVPAYRCAPCRERFFSVRVFRHIHSIESQTDSPVEPQAASG